MAGSSNQYAYQLGATLVTVATGATATQISPPRCTNGIYFGYQSGGSLAIVNAQGQTCAQGYLMGTTEHITIEGPSTFFLAAGGSTAIAAIVFKYSAGFSLFP